MALHPTFQHSTTDATVKFILISYKMAVIASNINILRHMDVLMIDYLYKYLHLIGFSYNFYLTWCYVW